MVIAPVEPVVLQSRDAIQAFPLRGAGNCAALEVPLAGRHGIEVGIHFEQLAISVDCLVDYSIGLVRESVFGFYLRRIKFPDPDRPLAALDPATMPLARIRK